MFQEQIPITEAKRLPAKMGLYGIFNEHEILYIGMSWDLKTRFYRHHKMNDFYKYKATTIRWILYEDVEKLHDDEHALIIKLKPILNVACHRRTTKRPHRNTNSDKNYYKILATQCSNDKYRIIFELAWEYVLSGKTKECAIKELSSITGLTVSWINSFLKHPTQDSSYSRVEALYFYLSGGKNLDSISL